MDEPKEACSVPGSEWDIPIRQGDSAGCMGLGGHDVYTAPDNGRSDASSGPLYPQDDLSWYTAQPLSGDTMMTSMGVGQLIQGFATSSQAAFSMANQPTTNGFDWSLAFPLPTAVINTPVVACRTYKPSGVTPLPPLLGTHIGQGTSTTGSMLGVPFRRISKTEQNRHVPHFDWKADASYWPNPEQSTSGFRGMNEETLAVNSSKVLLDLAENLVLPTLSAYSQAIDSSQSGGGCDQRPMLNSTSPAVETPALSDATRAPCASGSHVQAINTIIPPNPSPPGEPLPTIGGHQTICMFCGHALSTPSRPGETRRRVDCYKTHFFGDQSIATRKTKAKQAQRCPVISGMGCSWDKSTRSIANIEVMGEYLLDRYPQLLATNFTYKQLGRDVAMSLKNWWRLGVIDETKKAQWRMRAGVAETM